MRRRGGRWGGDRVALDALEDFELLVVAHLLPRPDPVLLHRIAERVLFLLVPVASERRDRVGGRLRHFAKRTIDVLRVSLPREAPVRDARADDAARARDGGRGSGSRVKRDLCERTARGGGVALTRMPPPLRRNSDDATTRASVDQTGVAFEREGLP
jgi:hypothetical protein